MSALISAVHVAYVTASVIALIGVSTILLRAAERTAARSTAIVTGGRGVAWEDAPGAWQAAAESSITAASPAPRPLIGPILGGRYTRSARSHVGP